jgi:hypothetical protein
MKRGYMSDRAVQRMLRPAGISKRRSRIDSDAVALEKAPEDLPYSWSQANPHYLDVSRNSQECGDGEGVCPFHSHNRYRRGMAGNNTQARQGYVHAHIRAKIRPYGTQTVWCIPSSCLSKIQERCACFVEPCGTVEICEFFGRSPQPLLITRDDCTMR